MENIYKTSEMPRDTLQLQSFPKFYEKGEQIFESNRTNRFLSNGPKQIIQQKIHVEKDFFKVY